MVLKLLLGLFLSFAQAQDPGGPGGWNNACFHGLNDSASGATLPDCDAQRILNVESNLQGNSARKRDGYSKIADLFVTTSPVNGAVSYIDSSGNRLQLVCHDRYCQKSTNGNAFTTVFSTAAAGVVRWSFVEAAGIARGGNSKYDPVLKYDGTTLSYPAGIPKGSILALANDRLVIGDIEGFPNRVYYSASGDYDDFTLGVDSIDAFFDDIGAPGDRVRGIVCVNGLCYFFKTSSITACEVKDQYTTQCGVVSPTIGTVSPAGIVTAGSMIYFEAQDGSYWELSSQGLRDISKKIPNLVKSKTGGLTGGERSNTQTSQSDWQAGSQDPSGTWDDDTTPGSVFPSSTTFIDTSVVDFTSGTSVNVSTNVVGTLSLTQSSSATFRNAGAEAGDSTNLTTLAGWINASAATLYGSRFFNPVGSGETCGDQSNNFTLKVLDGITQAELTRATVNISDGQGQTEYTIYTATYPAHSIILRGDWGTSTSHIYQTVPFIRPANIKFLLSDACGPRCCPAFDVDEGTYTLTGTFVSRAFDTTFSTPTWGAFNVNMSSNAFGGVSLQTQVSTDDSAYDSAVSVNNSQKPTSAQKRYIKYKTTFTVATSTNTSAIISDTSLPAATTGQFVTQCIEPNSSINAWGILSCAQTKTGNASIVFYATSAVSCALLPTTPPTTWQNSVTNNATLPIVTNTAFKIGWRSLLTSATEQAQVDACTAYWNEGTATKPVWAVYDSIKNAIYWTATVDNAASANRLLKYDRNLESWHPFDIQAQAPIMVNNSLRFGGATAGTWNEYGGVGTDAGQPINAYYQTKDIGSDKPFLEKNFQTYSLVARNNGSGVLYSTTTLSNNETSLFSVTLSTDSRINYIRSNNKMPLTSPQNFMNVKFGNNSSTPFEVLGLGVTWDAFPWAESNER